MPESLNAVAFQYVQHQGGSCYSIHIVVAPHSQLFAGQQFVCQQLGGFRHLGPAVRRGQAVKAGIQKGIDGLFMRKATSPEYLQ